MKKIFPIVCLFVLSANAQTLSLKEVLKAVETNNKELRLTRQQAVVQKQTDRNENNMEDPGVEYVQQWGTPGEVGNASELNVTQGFEFPTVYAQRGKLARERAVLYDYQYDEVRRDVLLRTELLCYDLVLINRKLELLNHKKEQTRELAQDIQKTVDEGNLTAVDGRKLKMEFLNLRVEEVNLRADREKLIQELVTLNGGVAIEVIATRCDTPEALIPYETYCTEALGNDARLRSLVQEKKVADKEISVSRQQNLPSIELGYRRTTGFEEEFNGVIMGVSVPIFQNRGKVKQARLQRQLIDMQHEAERTSTENSLQTTYNEVAELKKLLDEYGETTLNDDWCDDLKQLLDAHELTTLDFFAELSVVHQSYITRLELENRYHKALAELYKHRL